MGKSGEPKPESGKPLALCPFYLCSIRVPSVFHPWLPVSAFSIETNMPSTKLEQLRAEFIENFPRITKNTTPGDAAFLRIMIESSRAKRGLEIGTATGYGAILMGLGMERNGGKLWCVDVDAAMVAIARDNIQKVRLQRTVKVVEGDALAMIPRLKG